MREHFFEYYPQTQSELAALWKDCVLVLDTNILLNLYRLTESTRNDLLGILEKFSDKLWMPHQVGFEYHNNRESVIESIGYEKINSLIQDEFANLKNKIRSEYSRNPFISLDDWEKRITKESESIEKFLKNKYKEAPDYIREDGIQTSLNKLYTGKVGECLSIVDLQKIYDEGKIRYAAKVPPGYEDEKEKKGRGERHLYGDLIIWKEIIGKSKKEGKDIMFVSDDLKEGWIRIVHGKKKGPRWELRREFYEESAGRNVMILNQQQFLDFIHNQPDYSIKSKTLKEIESIHTKERLDKTGIPNIDPSTYYRYLRTIQGKNANLPTIHSVFERISEMANSGVFDLNNFFIESLDNPGGEDPAQEGEDSGDNSITDEESK